MSSSVLAPRTQLSVVRGSVTAAYCSIYITRRASLARHLADGFSSGLWLARRDRTIGSLWAFDYARSLVPLIPTDTETLVSPPPARGRGPQDFDLGRVIAAEVAELSGLPLIDPLRRSATRSGQAGERDETGMIASTTELQDTRLCLVDDLLTTGRKLETCARALMVAGCGQPPTAVVLAVTERAATRRSRRSGAREPAIQASAAGT